ncbi:MAG: tRNA (guanosine(37)-N1)-methyltransferase TrmD [Thermoanaerobaculia bacterium]|nr:tRNA (guanosine(37)-N1)-methyltransferase TrmD [Thermoanaerobaculia bacterium]
MRIQVVTIFPELFETWLETSLIGRARAAGLLEVEVHNLRSYTDDPHRVVDDEPYGGGSGMVMTAAPWLRAIRELSPRARCILMSPQGRRLDDAKVRELAAGEDLVLMCGRYEGIDERVREMVVDEELSIGDYVMSGGELPAMVVIEALSRYIPGVVGRQSSVIEDSFHQGLLDYPHYTRPAQVEDHEVPPVLLSGNHAEIEKWRRQQAVRATWEKRPDLLRDATLTQEQKEELTRLQSAAACTSGEPAK